MMRDFWDCLVMASIWIGLILAFFLVVIPAAFTLFVLWGEYVMEPLVDWLIRIT